MPNSSTASTNLPPGLILIDDFIDEEMEQKLLTSIEWNEGSAATETGKWKEVARFLENEFPVQNSWNLMWCNQAN